MNCELVLCSYERGIILEQHDFFVAQLKSRVLSRFEDIASEADEKAAQCLSALISETKDDLANRGNLFEIAHAEGLELYESLWEMKRQMFLSAFALLYHQWDKGLRTFLDRELSHCIRRDVVKEAVWRPNVDQILVKLEKLGWRVSDADWFDQIKIARLIVNVFKHGRGRALDELYKLQPQYVLGPIRDLKGELGVLFSSEEDDLSSDNRFEPDHEFLEVSEVDFDNLAFAIRGFWTQVPENTKVSDQF